MKNMSPSPITAGQAGKFSDLLVAGLRKSGLPSKQTQEVLESQGAVLTEEFVANLRKRVDAISGMIVRRVKVDRTITSQAAIEATGRMLEVASTVVAEMPQGEGDEVEVCFFKLDLSSGDGYISDEDLVREYDLRGLKTDPRAQVAVNTDDPAFADVHPNVCPWKDKKGYWYFSMFFRRNERIVRVQEPDDDWDDYCWFAGVRK